MKGKTVYRTMFWYGGGITVCSEHSSQDAAKRAARKCERRGGAKHWIEYVVVVDGFEEWGKR